MPQWRLFFILAISKLTAEYIYLKKLFRLRLQISNNFGSGSATLEKILYFNSYKVYFLNKILLLRRRILFLFKRFSLHEQLSPETFLAPVISAGKSTPSSIFFFVHSQVTEIIYLIETLSLSI